MARPQRQPNSTPPTTHPQQHIPNNNTPPTTHPHPPHSRGEPVVRHLLQGYCKATTTATTPPTITITNPTCGEAVVRRLLEQSTTATTKNKTQADNPWWGIFARSCAAAGLEIEPEIFPAGADAWLTGDAMLRHVDSGVFECARVHSGFEGCPITRPQD